MVGQYYLLSVKVFGGESLTFIGEAFFRMQKSSLIVINKRTFLLPLCLAIQALVILPYLTTE